MKGGGCWSPKNSKFGQIYSFLPHRIDMNDATNKLKYGMEEHKKGSLLHANIP